jgi:tetratricopeptide (TPR) repeat protein
MGFNPKHAWMFPIAAVLTSCLLPGVAPAGPAEDFQRLNKRFWELMDAGRYREAERGAMGLRRLAEGPLADQPVRMAQALTALADVYTKQARYAEAEPLYQEGLKVFRAALGAEHRHVAATLNNLAILYDEQGRYAEAELRYQESLRIEKNIFGAEHLRVGQGLNNLRPPDIALLGYDRLAGLYSQAET